MTTAPQSITETFRKAGIDIDDENTMRAIEAVAYSGDSVRRFAQVASMAQPPQTSAPAAIPA